MHNWITTDDGVRLAARHWHPDEHRGTAVVLVHGFGATKDDDTVVAVAETLVDQGHLVVSYTARGHGESHGHCTLGDLEHLDVAAGVALARADADRVVVVGTSMGAIAVLRHAVTAGEVDEHLDGVVVVSSPAEWRLGTIQSAGAAVMTQTTPGRWAARRFLGVRLAPGWSGAEEPVALAARLHAPLVVVHGTGDRFIRHDEAHKLHAATDGRGRLVLVPGMGHAYMPESRPVIAEAVDWTLRAGHAGRN